MSASLSESELLAARTACEELFLDFHRLIDQGRATQALALFTDVPVPRFEVRGEVHLGTEALAAFLAARERNTTRQTRHLASNFRFELVSDDEAHATANLSLFHRGGEGGKDLIMEAIVDCELVFVRIETGEWRVSSRRHSRFASVRD
jgi:hypothetical protein